MIHVYCGDGKGKTSACVGLSVRAAGCGYKVIFTQFLKGGQTGELAVLSGIPNLCILRNNGPVKFSFQMNETEKGASLQKNNALFDEAVSRIDSDKTLLVLDEAVGAMDIGLLDKARVLDFLRKNPAAEVVLTGRNPAPELLELADYISELKKVKHPFDRGIAAREGIEY